MTGGFFSKLFNRGQQQRVKVTFANHGVRRSLSAPEPTSDDESGPIEPRAAWLGARADDGSAGGLPQPPVPRRAGTELRRSQTCEPVGAGASTRTSNLRSARHSMSSSCDGSIDDQLRRQYGRVRPCHRGRRALIMEGTDRITKRRVIVKAFAKATMSPTLRDKMEREVEVLHLAAGCTGVVRLLNRMEDVTNTYLIMECVPGATLIETMANSGGRLSEGRCVAEVVAPLLRALAALHSLGVVHRDIKPEHILCHGPSIKLVDFCESAMLAANNLNHRVGQLEYMAPEVLNKPTAEEVFHQVLYNGMSESELPQYDDKADVWSSGAVIFEALTGQQPFMAETREELAEMHAALAADQAAGRFPRRLDHPGLSAGARAFLAAALTVDPAARPSAAALLQHSWVVAHAPSPPPPDVPDWMASAHGLGPLPKIPSQHRLSGVEIAPAEAHGKDARRITIPSDAAFA